MKLALVILLSLCGTASAQDAALAGASVQIDPRRLVPPLESQRNYALTEAARAEARLAQVLDENVQLHAQIESLQKQLAEKEQAK